MHVIIMHPSSRHCVHFSNTVAKARTTRCEADIIWKNKILTLPEPPNTAYGLVHFYKLLLWLRKSYFFPQCPSISSERAVLRTAWILRYRKLLNYLGEDGYFFCRNCTLFSLFFQNPLFFWTNDFRQVPSVIDIVHCTDRSRISPFLPVS